MQRTAESVKMTVPPGRINAFYSCAVYCAVSKLYQWHLMGCYTQFFPTLEKIILVREKAAINAYIFLNIFLFV